MPSIAILGGSVIGSADVYDGLLAAGANELAFAPPPAE